MAYYLKPQDDEEQQQSQTPGQKEGGQYTVPQAPSPLQQINKTNMEGGTVQPVGPSSAAPAAMAPATAPVQGPTRSKGGFVNLQRYLEANPQWHPEDKAKEIADKIGGEIDKSFQDATAGTKSFLANGGPADYQKQFNQFTVKENSPDLAQTGQQYPHKFGNPYQYPVTIESSPDPYPDYKSLVELASTGNAEAQKLLKQIMTKDELPKDTAWSLTPEQKEKIKGLGDLNLVGKNSLLSQMTANNPNYSSGMAGLDQALMQVKPGTQEKLKKLSEMLGNKEKGLGEEQEKLNKQLGLMRLRDEQLADYAKGSLGDWYNQLIGAPTREGEVPTPQAFDYSEQGVPQWAKYLAEILGQDPNKYQMKAKPEAQPQVTQGEAGKAVSEQEKALEKKPKVRRKVMMQEEAGI